MTQRTTHEPGSVTTQVADGVGSVTFGHPKGNSLPAALLGELAASNPEATTAMKRVLWQGTEHWPELLAERARLSGTLVVSGFARQAIERLSN